MGLNKSLKFLSRLIDKALTLFFILCLLLGCYIMYDLAYVYEGAASSKTLSYKPVKEANAEEITETLLEISDDVVAWITIDDTNIDYPVMQAEDNSKYLNLDAFGKYSLSGSIFMDYRNALDFSDDYSLLYGHHMDGGNMFGSLDEFLNKSYFNSHKEGTLMLLDGRVYPLYVFGVLETDASVRYLFDPTYKSVDMSVKEYVEEKTSIAIPEGAKIIALSTCKTTTSTARLIVFCYYLPSEGTVGMKRTGAGTWMVMD